VNWDSTTIVHVGGQYIKLGTSISATEGNIYNLRNTGWVAADADLASTSSGPIVFSFKTGTINDFLVNGFILINDTLIGGTSVIGAPCYVSTTAGQITFTQPSGTGDVVRIVGHCLDKYSDGRGGNSTLIRFNPSNDWIEL
jgi:hypothetical protein